MELTKSIKRKKPIGLRRFHLFVGPRAQSKKLFVASYSSSADAILAAEERKTLPEMRWQVLDSHTSEVVAEDPGN
jgi:hypothetical protein